jgi:hypothetical protein
VQHIVQQQIELVIDIHIHLIDSHHHRRLSSPKHFNAVVRVLF